MFRPKNWQGKKLAERAWEPMRHSSPKADHHCEIGGALRASIGVLLEEIGNLDNRAIVSSTSAIPRTCQIER
jgi:hypothetical protein